MNQDTCVYIDEASDPYVSLSFLDSGSVITFSREVVLSSTEYRRIVLISLDYDFVYTSALQLLEKGVSEVDVVWNFRMNPYFSGRLKSLLDGSLCSRLYVSGEVAHVILFAMQPASQCEVGYKHPDFQLESLLEMERSGVYIPRELLTQLIWRYQYILDRYDSLFSDSGARGDITDIESNGTESVHLRNQPKKLLDEIDRLSEIEHRYNALSRSKLGALQLKYWRFRRGRKND